MNGNLIAAFVRYNLYTARRQQYTVESIKSIMHLNVIRVRLRWKTLETLGCTSKFVEKLKRKVLHNDLGDLDVIQGTVLYYI